MAGWLTVAGERREGGVGSHIALAKKRFCAGTAFVTITRQGVLPKRRGFGDLRDSFGTSFAELNKGLPPKDFARPEIR